jgi:hypothetical protein
MSIPPFLTAARTDLDDPISTPKGDDFRREVTYSGS